ncbi:nitroreductase family deazaflavin-dependent oxidoreductase [Gordonia liuliyuniae]|uniref:Nitroreductase family deazaflavin-dependent oxidoreductase n=1 Tax=Gordonia liuliyuniae TaxID=2911517 RepID=A0ABS9IQH4_9ACTN|nr:nitroreductase family deazaflavin-dependent oxidoreductase [Gordonia liuliyuniae]MCF8587807.1 nitroreductase family deazaflavin-dependent oxidoreductase [Gordonia liuliyuniae]
MRNTTEATLATPLTLPSGQVLPNRMMKAALSEGLADAAGGPDTRLTRLYARWADGGFGLIVTGNVMVDSRHLGEPGNIVVEDERHLAGLTRWAKTTQDGGAKVWMQLNHPGRQANPITGAGPAVAPSAVGVSIPGVPTPRELSREEIPEIVRRFVTAAAVAETAGFDGIQIHGAHGYLVSQFLSPLSNQRTDGWGGDVAGRARFLLEIVRGVREAVRPGFGVGVKLNSADFQRGGFTEDDSRAVISMVARESVDLIEVSGGSYESPAMMGRPVVSASTRTREAYFLEYAETVRELAGDVPLAVTGGFRTRAAMGDAVVGGKCDVVGIGRPAAVEPEAARGLTDKSVSVLVSPTVRLRVPNRVRRSAPTVKTLEGALDLQWHTDQLHRMGAGLEPDAARPVWRTALTAVQRNGVDAFRSRRANGSAVGGASLRKFQIERAIGRRVANPAVEFAMRRGLVSTLATRLETTGRKSGLVRAVPVSASFDDTGAWLISQHGLRAGWTLNIQADPTVRIRQGNRWRTGTAEVLPDDDVDARTRSFAPHPALGPVTSVMFRALQSDPVSVRITFDDAGPNICPSNNESSDERCRA